MYGSGIETELELIVTKVQRLTLSRLKTNHVWTRKPDDECVKVSMTEAVNIVLYEQATPVLVYLSTP